MSLSKSTIIVCILLILTASTARASTYVAVEDEGVYRILSRLEAEGVIKTGILDTKPISRKEAIRLLIEADEQYGSSTEFIRRLVGELRERLAPEPVEEPQIKPIDRVYAKYVRTTSDVFAVNYAGAWENEQAFNYNNNGDLYRSGSNERTGFTSRMEDWGPVSLFFNPEYRSPVAHYTAYQGESYAKDELAVKKAYAVLDLGWDVVVGKDSQWWGPGYHGALLVSNNAEPFTMLKLTNPTPGRLPWIFEGLGPFRFTFFVTELEKARTVAQPYLYGMRIDLKPSPYLELAIGKTALVGGKGQPNDLGTMIDSLLSQTHGGQNYHSQSYVNIDDERVGFDCKLTVPWHIQPMQFYLQADGEDESSRLPVPQTWAFLGGVYLPRVLGAERFGLRMEYATTRGRVNNPYVWYTNYTYTSYTYEGNIIGHHMGTDAQDFFTEVSYLMPERNGSLTLSYDREEHNLYIAGSHETKQEISTGIDLNVTAHVDLSARYGFGRLVNQGNLSGYSTRPSEFEMEFGYRF